MIPPVIEGFVVDGPLPSAHPRVSRWLLGGDGGEAFVGGEALVERARLLPTWGPFDAVRIVDQSVVVVPGRLVTAIPELARRLTPGARVALAWHVAGYIAQLHEGGGAHGAIDSGSVGLDDAGRLHVRPALHLDRDETAAAQVYDCVLLGRLFDSLHLEETGDRNVALVLQGLRGERIRLAPGWAVRQALMAILVRHAEWEKELVAALGAGFRLDALDELEPPPIAESEDEVSLEADDSGAEDPPTAPSFADGPWAEFPVAEEDLPQGADEETESFSRAVELPVTQPPAVEVAAEPTPIEGSAPPEPPSVPREPEEEPGVPVPDTPPQLPQEEPEDAPEQEEPIRDPDEAPEEDPEEAPTNPPQEQPEGRADDAAVEEDDEPSFDVLDLVPPDDAPEISLIGPGRTRELEVAWREDAPVVAPVPEEIDVAALAASVAAAVGELPPVDDRWPVEEPTPVETVVPINEWVSTSVEEPVSVAIDDPVSVSVEVPVVSVEEPESVAVEEPVVSVDEPVSVAIEEPVSVTAPAPAPVEDDPEPATVIANPRAPVAPAQRSELEFLDEPDTHDTGSQAPLFEPAVQVDDLPEPPRAPPPRRLEPVVLDEPRDGDAKWMAARGVTHDSARDAELGSGKWTEPARPLEELARELPKSPTRSMETVDGGTSTGTWLALAVLSFVLFAGAFFAFRSGEEKVATPPAVQATLRTQPDGAEVLVDGRTLGVSPVEVALPAAGKTIEVCAVWAGDRHCQKLSREQLEKGYTFARP